MVLNMSRRRRRFIIFSTCLFVLQGIAELLSEIGMYDIVRVSSLAMLRGSLASEEYGTHVVMVLQGHSELRDGIRVLPQLHLDYSLNRWSVVTDARLPGEVYGLMRLRLKGVIDLTQSLTSLQMDLQHACQGQHQISQRFRGHRPLELLTPLELNVYTHWMVGTAASQTAIIIQRSTKTITLLRSRIMRKLRARSLYELLLLQALLDINPARLFAEEKPTSNLRKPRLIKPSQRDMKWV